MTHAARRALCALIERYQARGGGAHYFGIDCNFTPTCSEYTRQAVAAQGVWHGLRLGWRRIRRCNQRDLPQRTVDTFSPQAPQALSPQALPSRSLLAPPVVTPCRSPCSKP